MMLDSWMLMVKGASCLDDGSMKQFLTDWYNWTEEGWCEIPALENASSAMQEDFYNGKLGAFVSSSNRATSISEKAQAAGINLGMSYTVGYGGYSAPLGGGSIGIIGKRSQPTGNCCRMGICQIPYER